MVNDDDDDNDQFIFSTNVLYVKKHFYFILGPTHVFCVNDQFTSKFHRVKIQTGKAVYITVKWAVGMEGFWGCQSPEKALSANLRL